MIAHSDMYRTTLSAVATEYDLEPRRILGEDRTGRASDARKELIWRLHTASVSHVAIADWLNRSVTYVNTVVRNRALRDGVRNVHGLVVQARDRQDEVRALIKQGVSLVDVAQQTGYTYGSLRTVLSRMRKRRSSLSLQPRKGNQIMTTKKPSTTTISKTTTGVTEFVEHSTDVQLAHAPERPPLHPREFRVRCIPLRQARRRYS